MPWNVCSFWWAGMWMFITPGLVMVNYAKYYVLYNWISDVISSLQFICIYSWYDYEEVSLGTHEFVE